MKIGVIEGATTIPHASLIADLAGGLPTQAELTVVKESICAYSRMPLVAGVEQKEIVMTMLKVIEVLAESNKSWEDAAQQAVANASKSVRNIRSIWIDNFEAKVDDAKITTYRINAKISFVLD